MDQLQSKLDQAVSDNKDVFLAQMEEKYDTRFLPLSYTGSSVVVKEEFRCYAEGTDPERDYVRVFRCEEDGQTVYHDDYFGVLIRQEYQDRVRAVCQRYVGENKAYVYRYTSAYFDDSLTQEHTIDDAIAMGERIHAVKYVFFEVEPGSEAKFQESCDRIAEDLSQAGLPGTVKFIGLADGELEKIRDKDYLKCIPDICKADGKICLMMAERYVSV